MMKLLYRKPLFFASFIVIFIGIQGVWFKTELKEAYANGKDVYAKIVDRDVCGSGRRNLSIKIDYNKHTYIKSLRREYCDAGIGSQILVRYDKKTDNLLYINEEFDQDINCSYLILIAGIIIAIIGWRKK